MLDCTDPNALGPVPTAGTTASAARVPSNVGVLRTDARVGRPELPTSTDRGCTEAPAAIDELRLLDAELGVLDPAPRAPSVFAGFFFVRQPELVPVPGATTITVRWSC